MTKPVVADMDYDFFGISHLCTVTRYYHWFYYHWFRKPDFKY